MSMTTIQDVRFRHSFTGKVILQVAVETIDPQDLETKTVWQDATMQNVMDAMRQGFINPKDNSEKQRE